jgi:hypothetical protein
MKKSQTSGRGRYTRHRSLPQVWLSELIDLPAKRMPEWHQYVDIREAAFSFAAKLLPCGNI